MKVLLLKNMGKLGTDGDVVSVKDGYANNFLIPQGLALKAEDNSFKKLEEIKKMKARRMQEAETKYKELAKIIAGISLTITSEVKDEEEIYGSITETNILKLLSEEGVNLEKGQIVLPQPIRKLGAYNLKVRLCPTVESEFRVWVVKK